MAKRKNSEEDEDMECIPSLSPANFSATMKEAVFQRIAPSTQWNLYKSSKEMKEIMREPLLKNLKLKFDVSFSEALRAFERRQNALIRVYLNSYFNPNGFNLNEEIEKVHEEYGFVLGSPGVIGYVLWEYEKKSMEL